MKTGGITEGAGRVRREKEKRGWGKSDKKRST